MLLQRRFEMLPSRQTVFRRAAIGSDAKKQMAPRRRQADLIKGFRIFGHKEYPETRKHREMLP
jgi:hypothetical protein